MFQSEAQLLLCCARTVAAPGVIDRMRQLAVTAGFDWEYFYLLARRHAVLPLVYLQLERHASDLVPAAQLAELKRQYQENVARNTLLTAELGRLVDLFAASGIETIAYKGPVLAVFAYGNLGLRRSVDLDVIVKKADVLRARDLLLADGYAATKSLSPAQQELLLRAQHNLQFARDNRRLLVELHWEVAPHLFASSVQGDELWRHLKTIEINGVALKTFAAEELLFSLCVHGSRHLWERLGWICDLAELISRHELNWPVLLERATRADCERMFLLGVQLAEKLLQAPLPAEVKECCDADARLQSLAAQVGEHLFNGPAHVPATAREIFKYNLGVRRSLGARARYLAHMLRPTDSDLGARSVPARFSFAYYLMRPFRLLFAPSVGKNFVTKTDK